MKNFSNRLAVWTGLLALFALVACSQQPSLRVGTNIWPGYEPGYLAEELGYFGRQPVEMVLLPSAAEVIRAYRNRAIDVAALTLDEALLIAESMPGQRIILITNYSNGGDVILAHPEFTSLEDLRGQRIGVEHTALGAYILARALEISGLSVEDVTVVPVPLDEHEDAYHSRRVDAVVTFEPRRSRLIAAGAVNVFDSREIPGEVVDALITNVEVIDSKSAALGALVQGWLRARDFMKAEPLEAARLVAPRQQLEPADFIEALEGIELPDRAGNLAMLVRGEEGIETNLRRLYAMMQAHGILETEDLSILQPEDRFVRMSEL